ncbi:unnamed protein product [Lepeophtheirus salmonis]|uniref:(salmon louse) hypothetical protein n=1 Tax=Lepeophtheirus salmonis TaxID=72036 RepID=A0A7R8H5H8_LEPSM|nr:unnamed protein product [Lepeophtheirus salmonis]CAF2864212.1 unnamed protein product [Lepeophtheirus salmonis]
MLLAVLLVEHTSLKVIKYNQQFPHILQLITVWPCFHIINCVGCTGRTHLGDSGNSTSISTQYFTEVIHEVTPYQPDTKDLRVLEDAASGVDLDFLIPALLAVVAASMASGGKRKEEVTGSEDNFHPRNNEQAGPSKRERLFVLFTLKHQTEGAPEGEGLAIITENVNKGTPTSKNMPRKTRSLLAARRFQERKFAGKEEHHQKKDNKGSSQKKGASDRGTFYSKTAVDQALRKEFGKTMSAVIYGSLISPETHKNARAFFGGMCGKNFNYL